MTIEVKSKIDMPRARVSKWGDVYAALNKAPVGGGIQEEFAKIGIKSHFEASNLFRSVGLKYGAGVFMCSGKKGLITIIRLKETPIIRLKETQ